MFLFEVILDCFASRQPIPTNLYALDFFVSEQPSNKTCAEPANPGRLGDRDEPRREALQWRNCQSILCCKDAAIILGFSEQIEHGTRRVFVCGAIGGLTDSLLYVLIFPHGTIDACFIAALTGEKPFVPETQSSKNHLSTTCCDRHALTS